MKLTARRRARERAVQALYSWQLSKNDIADIELQFLSKQDVKDFDINYFRELMSGVSIYAEKLDELMAPHLSRQLEELGQIERAILRIALFELSNRNDIPYKVSINEAIELTKIFGAEDSHKFINAVLDTVAPKIRQTKR
ncbi:MAG: transcription antitermination factor NusB [Candidatus Malihini olakiniferum]